MSSAHWRRALGQRYRSDSSSARRVCRSSNHWGHEHSPTRRRSYMGTPTNSHPRLRRALIVTTVVGGTLALLGGLAWGGQRSLVYLPSGGDPATAGEMSDGGADPPPHTEDGRELGGWCGPASGPTRGAAVLGTNGNAGSRESRVPLARARS